MLPDKLLIGYARTSTADQKAGLNAQVRDLRLAGASRIFTEQVSSVLQRAALCECLDALGAGDTLLVTKLDRLARSIPHLIEILAALEAKGAGLTILSWGGGQVDTRSAIGRLFIMMSGAFAAFERDIMLERQREGIEKAKAEGKYKGRVPTVGRQGDEIRTAIEGGEKPAVLARRLGIARSSVYRMLSDRKPSFMAKV
jgi:DNA invertase Pin-like site-specific DNA recombinase